MRIIRFVFGVSIATLLLTEGVLWVFVPLEVEVTVSVEIRQNLPGLKSDVTYTRNRFGFR